MKIPAEELRQIEAKCNVLISVQEDYHHLIRSLENNYGVRVRERRLRIIVGGGAGPVRVQLREDKPM